MAVQTRKSRKQARRLVPAPPFVPRIHQRRKAVGKGKYPAPAMRGRAGRYSFSIREMRDPYCVCAGDISVDGSAIGQALTDGQAAEDTAAVALGEVYVDGSGVGQIGCDC